MTEQEKQNKIKVVNELNALISNICKEENSCRRRRCQDCKLDYIADYILRKEEEVRKETAKKIIDFLKEQGNFGYDYPDEPHSPIVTFDPCIFEDIENEFGVEVEQ